MLRMPLLNHRALIVLLVVLVLWSLAGAFLWLDVTMPSDGARLPPGGPDNWHPDGVTVAPLVERPGGLQAGDVVTAVDGISVDEYARTLLDVTRPRPAWHVDQIVQYTVRRDGRTMNVPVTLGAYPLAAIIANEWSTILFAVVSQLVSLFVFFRRPRDPAARVLFLWAAGILSATTWSFGLQVGDMVNGAGFVLYLVTVFGSYLVFWAAGLHLALVFPQSLFPAKERWLIPTLYVALFALFALYIAAVYPGSTSTLDWIGQWGQGQGVLALIYLVLAIGAAIVNYRVSRGPARDKLRWVAWATLLSGVSGLLLWNLPGIILGYALIPSGALGLVVLPFPLAIAVAILRHRLFDIDVIINRTLVYGALTISTMALYALIVGYVGGLVQSLDRSMIAFLTTGLVAVLFQPLREWLQRGVNRLMYGERDDPYAVLARLGERLHATIASDAVLPTIVETVAQTLKLPYAGISLEQGDTFDTVAAYGSATGPLLVLPLTYQDQVVGQLSVSPRGRGEEFSPADRRLLDTIAHEAGVAVHAVRLTADLQHSRERLVAAREEERRRIRRDLHDGLGPALASLILKIEAARNLLASDPAAVDALLQGLASQTQAAITDIRRLVYELRPPALDELGLVGAIHAQAEQYDSPQTGLAVSVEATPGEIPPLPAAVEVAAYRIVLEALTNVVRHAHARNCAIRIQCDGALSLEIVDDGIGPLSTQRAGVGLASMRERAAELGGACSIEPAAGQRGTRVFARLPLPGQNGGKD